MWKRKSYEDLALAHPHSSTRSTRCTWSKNVESPSQGKHLRVCRPTHNILLKIWTSLHRIRWFAAPWKAEECYCVTTAIIWIQCLLAAQGTATKAYSANTRKDQRRCSQDYSFLPGPCVFWLHEGARKSTELTSVSESVCDHFSQRRMTKHQVLVLHTSPEQGEIMLMKVR